MGSHQLQRQMDGSPAPALHVQDVLAEAPHRTGEDAFQTAESPRISANRPPTSALERRTIPDIRGTRKSA